MFYLGKHKHEDNDIYKKRSTIIVDLLMDKLSYRADFQCYKKIMIYLLSKKSQNLLKKICFGHCIMPDRIDAYSFRESSQ